MYAGKTAPLYVGNILPVGSMPEGMIIIIHPSLHSFIIMIMMTIPKEP